MTTATNQPPPHIPAGAITVGEWEREGVRAFYGTKRVVETANGNIVIELEGEQFADGKVRRFLYVIERPTSIIVNGYETHKEGPATGPVTVEDARKFGAALIAAADEQDQMAEHDEVAR